MFLDQQIMEYLLTLMPLSETEISLLLSNLNALVTLYQITYDASELEPHPLEIVCILPTVTSARRTRDLGPFSLCCIRLLGCVLCPSSA